MKLHIKNFVIIAMLALVTLGGTTSCSSKKKLAQKEYEAKVEQAKKDLNAIINDETAWTLDEQKARIDEIEKADFQNPEIDELIVAAREKINRKVAEEARIAEEERLRLLEEQNKLKQETSLQDYFAIIAEALKLFASPDVPVLIIVYHVGDIIDYDAPTTAEKYLNYIKDHKKVNVGVYNVKYDNSNKITELELIKK